MFTSKRPASSVRLTPPTAAMSLFKTAFGKVQPQETHSREHKLHPPPALSRAVSESESVSASASASGLSRARRAWHKSSSSICTHILPQTIMPAVLEIHVEGREYPLSSHLNMNSQRLTKPKRVSAPLNEAVRESLCGNSTDPVHRMASETPYSTSGSDHGIDSMAPGFLDEREEDRAYSTWSGPDLSEDYGSDAESAGAQDSNPFPGDQIRETLQGVFCSYTKLEQMLVRDVTEALRMAEEKPGLLIENERQKISLRRFVMSNLRSSGYNAGICKSRWEKTNGYPAGDYEFVDVVFEGIGSMGKSDRLLVEIDLRAQFEIARPTEAYGAVVGVLPAVFVGRADKLRQTIRIMCDAARRSLKTQGMHIPPWRKARYMQAKWLGPYKRTTHPTPACHLGDQNCPQERGNGHGMGRLSRSPDADASPTGHERSQQTFTGKGESAARGAAMGSMQAGVVKFSTRGRAKTSGLATAAGPRDSVPLT